ncbi:MAG: HD domain-containing protein [Rickettsiales bacterium]|jgi:putative nucleotidyltransferase with HDIG domain|nr:HD domain-containing protein [Rickettsiales bacterium]
MEKRYEATKIILDAYARVENPTRWHLHKVKHTFEVAGASLQIAAAEQLPPAERETAEVIAILHDLGRFSQKGYDNKGFDHGDAAVELLREMKKFDDPLILFAVAEHNKFHISDDSLNALAPEIRDNALMHAKLIRDADKLANIRDFMRYDMPSNEEKRAPLSAAIRTVLLSGKPIMYKDVETYSDEVLSVLEWVNDIYFDYTRAELERMDYVGFALAALKARGATPEDLRLVEQRYGS